MRSRLKRLPARMKNIKYDDEYKLLSGITKKVIEFIKIKKLAVILLLLMVLLFFCINSGVICFSYNVYLDEKYIGKTTSVKIVYEMSANAGNIERIKAYPSVSFFEKTTPVDEISKKISSNKNSDDNSAELYDKPEVTSEKENVPEEQKPAFALPVTAEVSSGFGERWGREHKGIDFAANEGESVCASESGVVTYSDLAGTFGNLVILDHGSGIETYYAHLSKRDVSVGDNVSKGQKIGEVGNTGNSLGPHLHFELRKNKIPENPSDFIAFQ